MALGNAHCIPFNVATSLLSFLDKIPTWRYQGFPTALFHLQNKWIVIFL